MAMPRQLNVATRYGTLIKLLSSAPQSSCVVTTLCGKILPEGHLHGNSQADGGGEDFHGVRLRRYGSQRGRPSYRRPRDHQGPKPAFGEQHICRWPGII